MQYWKKNLADHWRTLNFSRHGFMSGVGFPDSLHEMISIVPLVAAEVGCISLSVTCRSQIASTDYAFNELHPPAGISLSKPTLQGAKRSISRRRFILKQMSRISGTNYPSEMSDLPRLLWRSLIIDLCSTLSAGVNAELDTNIKWHGVYATLVYTLLPKLCKHRSFGVFFFSLSEATAMNAGMRH